MLFIFLYMNPWLLKGGIYAGFRGLILSQDASESPMEFDDEGYADEQYRTVTVLRPMVTPSAEVLRKLVYDWGKSGKEDQGTHTTVQTRWGSEEENAPDEDINISETIEPEAETVPSGEEDAEDLANASNANPLIPEEDPGAATLPSIGVITGPETPAEETTPLEEPETENSEELAMNTVPTRIPDAVRKPESIDTSENIKTFDNESQAISGSGSGIFETQGFPLEEYASRIRELVYSNWYIPSNLRDSDGFTTIIFYIDRNGHNFDARIVDSSGNRSLNITALTAIMKSDPFPPLPDGYPGKHIGVKYIFIPEPQ